ncbi:MAG TPA: hypothetical protein VMI54_13940 [Polyangiaceae bacterium]|nr:hypothetical protein [Polyangiaceae bacterium]
MPHSGLRPRARLLLHVLAALCVTLGARAGDPWVHWYTLTTPHYHVHFQAGVEDVAQKVGTVAEDVYSRVSLELGFRPPRRTEIVLNDGTEEANGLAYTLPYPTVDLNVSAPDDMSTLGDYDDWVTILVTHELTHILHMSNVSGVPDLVNHVLGPTLAPNEEQPHWILEGLAVAMESEHTTGGRLRSTQFDMMLRADVLGGRIATLDEISHAARRWPAATLWYLYGAKFTEWIASIYGPDVYGAVATDYGAAIIPYGVNRAIRRATGRTYEELYAGWLADLKRQYGAQRDAVTRLGLREGRRVTFRGWQALDPRFLPASCHAPGRVAYVRADADTVGGIYELDLDGRQSPSAEELVARSTGRSLAFGPDCSLYFDVPVPSRRKYPFGDLFRLPAGASSPSGLDRERERLTTGRRTRDVDVSADGRRITYVTQDAGTSTLRIAELTPDGRIENERRLVPSAEFEQAFTPRFSPDGTRIAYGAWTAGGFRDIRIVDVASGRFRELWHDRALDMQPAWSHDGKTLFFASDRTGISNIYAYDVATGALSQVTNVVTGAYMPEPSADGRTLLYVGYTPDGFDLYTLALDPARYLPAAPPEDERPVPPGLVHRTWPVSDYAALPTLAPRAFSVSYGQGTFGNAFTLTANGADAIGRHAVTASLTLETRHADLLGELDYAYFELPFAFRASLFRSAAPRTDYRATGTAMTVTEHRTGVTTGVELPLPGDFDSQDLALSYTVLDWDHDQPLGASLDPDALVPTEPDRGVLATVHLGYQLSTATATTYAISLERGIGLGIGADFADPAWGSESTLIAFSGAFTGYLTMPWLRHHVLALGLSGGAAAGTYPRLDYYYTGGFADTPPLDALRTGVRQTGFVLRGYKPLQFSGSTYNLLNVEYRFPIVYVDRGLSTLPGFLQTLVGTAFLDWGGAYNQMDLRDPWQAYHVGVGGELRLDVSLVYADDTEFRLGFARGLDSKAPPGVQSYFVLASGF